MKHRHLLTTALSLSLGLSLCGTQAMAAPTVAQGFVTPPDDARPMVRWWWFGPAVVPGELTREIKAMKQGGFGGFEIQPVYPLALDDPSKGIHNLTYLSDEFLKDVGIANDEGRADGMRVDITLGSGWPYGGPHIGPDEASSKVTLTKIAIPAKSTDVALPTLAPGQHLVAGFIADGADMTKAAPVNLPATGHVTFTAAPADRTLLLVLQDRTGQQVKRPGVGGEGNVLDHMSSTAVQHHLHAVADRLITAFGDHPPYSVFSDSLEVFGGNWTDDLLPEFQKRRGYDLTPHLLDLFYDTPDSAAVRHDWSQTLSELADDRYLTPINDWAKAHNTKFRSQSYGMPPVTLSSNRLVALPEGEGPNWRKFSSTRWASSANHVYGNVVTSAETWTWLHGAAFRATPLDMKAEADTMMLEGVNQFVAHGWPYTPPSIPEPGWALYAAAVFNDHNPWWGVMPDITAYLQRMSYVMRQGQPEADVAILLPEDDAFANIKPGVEPSVNTQMGKYVTDAVMGQILDAGYTFDYVDATSLDLKGVGHKILILPHLSRISPATYQRVAAFAQSGGIVIAVDKLPDTGTGLTHAREDATAVRALSASLFTPTGHARQVSEADLGKTLASLSAPDITGKPAEFGFVHRHLADGNLYFVVNTGNTSQTAKLHFRAEQKKAQWWEPRTGEAHAWTPGTAVTLAPLESRVFVFGAAASATATPVDKAAHAQKTDLSGGWTVAFKDGQAHAIKTFTSWTSDPATQFYSGVASYKRTLTLTKAQIKAGQVVLDFGAGTPLTAPYRQQGTSALLDPPVREAAEVYVNGKRAGALWAAPYTVSLKGLVHPGQNQLDIRVSNTDVNLLAGRPNTDYSALTAKYGERFTAQGMNDLKPLPSGILHAVTLETPQ